MLSSLISETEFGARILEWIDVAALMIEIVAVLIIVGAIIIAIVRYTIRGLFEKSHESAYRELKIQLGKALLLGLEILVAADIIRTVALEATLQSVLVLGLLVLIRTFLSWALIVEIEGRWPWQPEKKSEKA